MPKPLSTIKRKDQIKDPEHFSSRVQTGLIINMLGITPKKKGQVYIPRPCISTIPSITNADELVSLNYHQKEEKGMEEKEEEEKEHERKEEEEKEGEEVKTTRRKKGEEE